MTRKMRETDPKLTQMIEPEEINATVIVFHGLNTEHIKQRRVKYKKHPNRTSRDKKCNV